MGGLHCGHGKGLVFAVVLQPCGCVRGESGFEFATGPNVSPTGLGFVFALGYNYQKGDLNLPINIAFVPNKQGPADSALGDIMDTDSNWDLVKMRDTGYRLTVTVGFNLRN